MRKPCPPSMAERPAQCSESNRAQLDFSRALFDHVAAAYHLTADCYETAEDEPQELLPILNFLIDLKDLTCYTRRGIIRTTSALSLLLSCRLCLCTCVLASATLSQSVCRCCCTKAVLGRLFPPADMRFRRAKSWPWRQMDCHYGSTAEHHGLVRALAHHLEPRRSIASAACLLHPLNKIATFTSISDQICGLPGLSRCCKAGCKQWQPLEQLGTSNSVRVLCRRPSKIRTSKQLLALLLNTFHLGSGVAVFRNRSMSGQPAPLLQIVGFARLRSQAVQATQHGTVF